MTEHIKNHTLSLLQSITMINFIEKTYTNVLDTLSIDESGRLTNSSLHFLPRIKGDQGKISFARSLLAVWNMDCRDLPYQRREENIHVHND